MFFKIKGNNSFQNKNSEWGITRTSNSNGAAYADFDNDGDLDMIVNNINQPAFVYRNESQKLNGNHFLQVKLSGEAGNIHGIGARVKDLSSMGKLNS